MVYIRVIARRYVLPPEYFRRSIDQKPAVYTNGWFVTAIYAHFSTRRRSCEPGIAGPSATNCYRTVGSRCGSQKLVRCAQAHALISLDDMLGQDRIRVRLADDEVYGCVVHYLVRINSMYSLLYTTRDNSSNRIARWPNYYTKHKLSLIHI